MRILLRQYFGENGDNALIVQRDGREWVLSRSLCDLIGVVDEYYLVYDQISWPEMNLTWDDKQRFDVEGAHLPWPYFVSKTGFWKIVARSNTLWAIKFRASFLPTEFPQADLTP